MAVHLQPCTSFWGSSFLFDLVHLASIVDLYIITLFSFSVNSRNNCSYRGVDTQAMMIWKMSSLPENR